MILSIVWGIVGFLLAMNVIVAYMNRESRYGMWALAISVAIIIFTVLRNFLLSGSLF